MLKIGNQKISVNDRPKIIAEISANHNQSLSKAIQLIKIAKVDLEIVKVLILRTTYPWEGEIKKNAELQAKDCFQNSDMTKNVQQYQQHIMKM